MGTQPIRIGIIGAGGIVTSRHLPGFGKIVDCEVVAVCNRRRESSEAVAREWNIPHVVDTAEALIAREDINTVLIGTYPNLHKELSLAALQAGKHVFCQARMAMNLSEAREMEAAALAHPNFVTAICIGPRLILGEKYIRKLVEDGVLGDIRLVRVNCMEDQWANPDSPAHWRQTRETSGNHIMALGIYNEEMNRIFGPARTVSATGILFNRERKDADTGASVKTDVPESICVSGELESGGHYVYNLSYLSHFGEGDSLEVYGTKGTVLFDVANKTIRLGRVGKDETLQPVTIPDSLRWEWNVEERFAAAIRQGTPVVPDFSEGVLYMQFVEAVRLSLDGASTIRLPL